MQGIYQVLRHRWDRADAWPGPAIAHPVLPYPVLDSIEVAMVERVHDRDEMLAQAARLAQGAEPASARALVGRLLAGDPADADALTVQGIVEQRTGNPDAAASAFRKACEADPGNPARIGNLAVALKNAGRFEDAIAAFRETLRLRPGHAATLANLASCLLAAGRPAEAIAALDPVPRHPDALNHLGVAHARLGDHDRAVECYRAALGLRPGHGGATLNLVDALAETGAVEEAETIAKGVLAQAPGHPRASNQLGLLRDRAGDTGGAIAAFEKGFDPAAPHHALGVNLARILVIAGRCEDAVGVTETLERDSPDVTTPLALRCAALERLGRRDELAALMGVDRFVTSRDFEAVPGFASLGEFNSALIAELEAHPSLTFEPEGLVTRQGRQSADLAGDDSPAISALAAIARAELAKERERLSRLPADHPFLRALPHEWSLTLWGTTLTPGGSVDAHIHAPNWLSGVYYPDFPDGSEEGAFAVGCLPDDLGGGGQATVMRPATGRMFLFPSYLWHGTLPFSDAKARVSFAFDLVPEGIGRPHRLR